MIDVTRLRVLRAVVASGSIQAAATHLGYSPSAVSQQMTALQRETGLVLLERSGRGVVVTAAGRELAGAAESVLASLSDVETRVRDLVTGRTSSLSMAFFDSVGSAWMPTVVRRLLDDFPNLRLELALRETSPNAPDDWVDLQLVVEDRGYVPPVGLVAHHLIDEPYLAVVSTTHPFAAEAEIELARLADENWIDHDPADGWCHRTLFRACAAAGFVPTSHVQVGDHYTAIAFAAAGVGVTIVPRLCTVGMPSDVVAIPVVRPTPRRSITLVVRESVQHSEPVRRAIRHIVAQARTGRSRSRPTAYDGATRAVGEEPAGGGSVRDRAHA